MAQTPKPDLIASDKGRKPKIQNPVDNLGRALNLLATGSGAVIIGFLCLEETVIRTDGMTDSRDCVLDYHHFPLTDRLVLELKGEGYLEKAPPHLEGDYRISEKGRERHRELCSAQIEQARQALLRSGKSTSSLLQHRGVRVLWALGPYSEHSRGDDECRHFSNPFGEQFAVFPDGEVVVLPKKEK